MPAGFTFDGATKDATQAHQYSRRDQPRERANPDDRRSNRRCRLNNYFSKRSKHFIR
jgi:hypothetical protein